MSKKSNITILKSADCWKLELQSALDFVETDGACGSLEDLYAATNILYARLCERFPGGDFTQIPRVYELLANHRHHQLGLSELQPMANAAVMVVGRISDELVKDHRNSKNGGREQSTNDRMLAIFTKDKRCVGWTQREWATKMRVSPGAVAKTAAWRAILTERAEQKKALKKGGYSVLR